MFALYFITLPQILPRNNMSSLATSRPAADMPAARASSGAHPAAPLPILAGDSTPPVLAGGVEFRAAVQRVIDLRLDEVLQTQPSYSALRQWSGAQSRHLGRRALIYALATTAACSGSTVVLRNMLELIYHSDEDESRQWYRLMRRACCQRGLRLSERRYIRMRDIAELVPLPVVSALLQAFELEVVAARRHTAPQQRQGYARLASQPFKDRTIKPPQPWLASDPPLVLGQNGAFYGIDAAHPESLRHMLVLGETGSGKTVSVAVPALSSTLRYMLPNGKRGSLLVIDPKCELAAVIDTTLAESGTPSRLHTVGVMPPIQYFHPRQVLPITDKFKQCLEFFPPAEGSSSNNSYWIQLGIKTWTDYLRLAEAFYHGSQGLRLAPEWARAMGLTFDVSDNTWAGLRTVLDHVRGAGSAELKKAYQSLRRICLAHGVDEALLRPAGVFNGDSELFRQFSYAIQSTDPYITPLSSPELAQYVDLDPLPEQGKPRTDVADLVEQGQVILFQPKNLETHNVAAKAIKTKFFEAVFSRDDMERPVFYIVDEFQRFITHGRESGEQSFLDRCRAYRVMCMFATQSFASLRHELGSTPQANNIIDIIRANTPTKFLMRTTDAGTTDWLRALIPPPPTPGPHVVDVRRPLEFKPGEAYVLRADGSWTIGRARIDHML